MTESAVLLCGHGSRDPQAIEEFKKALAINPNFAPAHYGLNAGHLLLFRLC